MRVEVDQSGRVDQTDRPTVLALSNGIQRSIRVPSTVKRECLVMLRQRWGSRDPKSLYVFLFATLLYFLLKDHVAKLSNIVVDEELPGHEASIKEHVLNLFRRHEVDVDRHTISFHLVGKKSPAHKLAFRVYSGLAVAQQVITAEEILKEFRK